MFCEAVGVSRTLGADAVTVIASATVLTFMDASAPPTCETPTVTFFVTVFIPASSN